MKQLSQYIGFQFIINWDTFYDLCLPNYSFVHPRGPPLELGHFTKMKKEHSNKTLIDHPEVLLEVVHCNIDLTTCYTWIYLLKSIHHDSIPSIFAQ